VRIYVFNGSLTTKTAFFIYSLHALCSGIAIAVALINKPTLRSGNANMLSNINRLQSDERGSIAIIFGLTSFVLFWCIGFAIDGGRAYAVNTRLVRAIDSAALAGARGMRINNLSNSETETLTREFFKVNFEAGGGDFSQIQGTPDVKLDRDKGSVELNVVAFVPTTFAGIGGLDKMTINKSSVAIFTQKDLEISLQLDLTGSMREDDGTGTMKIEALKSATASFIEILLPDVSTGQKVRIGLAPFDAGVNAGPYLNDVDGKRPSSQKCTYERKSPSNQTTDNLPLGSDALLIAEDVNRKFCPDAEVIAMTDNKSTLKNAVKNYTYGDYTAGHLGTAWAYYLLSPNWSSIWPNASKPTAYNDNNSKKIAVLMTDGKYNTVNSNPGNDAASRKFAKDTCAAMKLDGITIYTIGFKLDDVDAKATMQACASDPAKALLAENGAQLTGVFNSIANQITSLRLSQ
jgi:Flp pilus assembly protein TadG